MRPTKEQLVVRNVVTDLGQILDQNRNIDPKLWYLLSAVRGRLLDQLPPDDTKLEDNPFLQRGFNKQLSHVIEECGEVLAAAGKTQRWGKDSVNPLLPRDQQETNIDWLKRELQDLKSAISRLEETMDKECL